MSSPDPRPARKPTRPFLRVLRWALIVCLVLGLAAAVAGFLVYSSVASRLPEVHSLRDVEMQEPMYVYARDGRLIALFGEMRRYPVEIEDVPERLKQAFLATEDARFYEHAGVDYRGVARAIWLLAKTRGQERVPGGSTITQQVARQFYLSTEYSFTRKFAEMLLARKMEKELSKDEIFELYLNKSFFGNRAYGVAAAAEFYFGKTLDQLDLDEMASLAAIPKFPSSGNPLSNPERARERRDDYVLARMRELGFITEDEYRQARAVPMHAKPHERPVEVYAPYVAEMVRLEMEARYGGDVLNKGYHVTTTIDPAMQAAAGQAVRDGLLLYDHRHGWNKTPEQVFELAPDEDAETVAERLRGIPAQGGLLPAIVVGTGDASAEVVLADGTRLTLDAASSRWTGKHPAALVARGQLVRVRRVETPAKDGGSQEAPPPKVSWQLAQLPRAQATLVALEPDNGALRALVGGFSFAGNKFNRTTQARRQPGSSFKPFIYAAAFERGFNPASIVLDAPVVFRMRGSQEWRPKNSDGRFAGPMRLREALVRSRNLVSVRLLDAIGVDYARRYISHFGFEESELPPNLSISLGTPSLTPLSVARGYAVFSNGGFRIDPWFIDEVRDRNGELLFKENPAIACRSCGSDGQPSAVAPVHVVDGFNLGPAMPVTTTTTGDAEQEPLELPEDAELAPRAIDARVAYQLVSMMRDVVQRGTGAAARVLGREDVGGKTGSTNDHRDAWFSGFGGNLVTSVWVGRDDNRSLGYREYGGRAALPIWIDFMRVALEGVPIASNEPPAGMVKVSVSADGRLLTGATGGIVEYVKVEDLERMERVNEFDFDDLPPEEAFDIF